MNDWEVVSNSGQEMVLVRGVALKDFDTSAPLPYDP